MRVIGVLLVCFFHLSACANSPQNLALFYEDTKSEFYTQGQGETKTAAIKDALASLSLRLSSQIQAEVHTLQVQNRQDGEISERRSYFESAQQRSRQFTFNNYQIEKVVPQGEQTLVWLSVARQPFFESLLATSEKLLNDIISIQNNSRLSNNLARLALTQFALSEISTKLYADVALLDAFNYPNALMENYQAARQSAISAAANFDYQFIIPAELDFLNKSFAEYQRGLGFTLGQPKLTIFVSGALLEKQDKGPALKASLQLLWLNPLGQMQVLSRVINVEASGRSPKARLAEQLEAQEIL